MRHCLNQCVVSYSQLWSGCRAGSFHGWSIRQQFWLKPTVVHCRLPIVPPLSWSCHISSYCSPSAVAERSPLLWWLITTSVVADQPPLLRLVLPKGVRMTMDINTIAKKGWRPIEVIKDIKVTKLPVQMLIWSLFGETL